jgi:SAM-dependent methyltransferase
VTPENPFETRFLEYDAWFDTHRNLFESELLAIRAVLPEEGFDPRRAVEIGVGSGRFAQALGIPVGIEPASGIASLARERGIEVIQGVAEALPLEDDSTDAAFLITSLCFIADAPAAFAEVRRVLSPSGWAIVAFVPGDSPFGRLYASEDDPFFRHARLRSRSEVIEELEAADLQIEQASQTLLGERPEDAGERVQAPISGWEHGSFVVLRMGRPPVSSST